MGILHLNNIYVILSVCFKRVHMYNHRNAQNTKPVLHLSIGFFSFFTSQATLKANIELSNAQDMHHVVLKALQKCFSISIGECVSIPLTVGNVIVRLW